MDRKPKVPFGMGRKKVKKDTYDEEFEEHVEDLEKRKDELKKRDAQRKKERDDARKPYLLEYDDDGKPIGANEELDKLRQSFKLHLNDQEQDEKKEMVVKKADAKKGKFSTRCVFVSKCSSIDDKERGYISFLEFERVLTTIKYPSSLKGDIKRLLKSHQCFDETKDRVYYKSLLVGLYKRSSTSFHGYFPLIWNRLMKKKQEEKKRKMEEERKKREEAKSEKQKKQDEQNKALEGSKGPSISLPKNEAKEKQMRERIEQERKERLAAEEKKRAQEFREEHIDKARKTINYLVTKIKKSKQKVRDVFNLFDENKDKRIDRKEMTKVLIECKVRVIPAELEVMFDILDKSKCGSICFDDFCDIIEGTSPVDYDEYIARKREEFEEKKKERELREKEGKGDEPVEEVKEEAPDEDKFIIPEEGFLQTRVYDHIATFKEALLTKALNFEEILGHLPEVKRGEPDGIDLEGFEKLAEEYLSGELSRVQVKDVFNEYAKQDEKNLTRKKFISIREFKDVFYPKIDWKRDEGDVLKGPLGKSEGDEDSMFSGTARSQDIGDVIKGRKFDSALKGLDDTSFLLSKGNIIQELQGEEDGYESEATHESKEIGDIIAQKQPRGYGKKVGLEVVEGDNEIVAEESAIIARPPIHMFVKLEKSLDKLFKQFCKKITLECKSTNREIGDLVDFYGSDTSGYLNYEEFKQVLENHYVEDGDIPMPDAPKLKNLFFIFDTMSINRIKKDDFEVIIQEQKPVSNVVERITNKMKKAGKRFSNLISEEFQEADSENTGIIPLPIAQSIMIEYDIPLLEKDFPHLKANDILTKDGKSLDYSRLLELATPNIVGNAHTVLHKLVSRLQAAWRGYSTRKKHKSGFFGGKNNNALFHLGLASQDLRPGESPVKKKDEKKPKKKKAKKGKKTKQFGVTKPKSLKEKMEKKIKSKAGGKDEEWRIANRKIAEDFVKNKLLEEMIDKAVMAGESIHITREAQTKFQERPVTKHVFPVIQEFNQAVLGVPPKSIYTVGNLGRVLYMDWETNLNQIDFSSTQALQTIRMGNRPPLKHYEIIDMVCDQSSGRIYTLSKNWMLEIWNFEQDNTLPIMRVSVCSADSEKDYIEHYYTNTFSGSKPRFLSLYAHNRQVLVVNTSCVDGSIVFIDPISFSVIKRIQLKFSDYETPRAIKEAIRYLRSVFKMIEKHSQYTITDIFQGMASNQPTVTIKEFVQKMVALDASLSESLLYQTCNTIDINQDGTIDKKEFLTLFEQECDEADGHQDEAALDEAVWPTWVIQEDAIVRAKELILKVNDCMEKMMISPDNAFAVFDAKDLGAVTQDSYRRVFLTFCKNVLTEDDIEFLVKLSPKLEDDEDMVNYRKVLTKYFDKRRLRAFKQDGGTTAKECDTNLKKESNIIYVIRKAFQLGISLRQVFRRNDEKKIDVIPKKRFHRILEGLPLGLDSKDINEIYENDLHFDRNGNVDYTYILTTDLYSTLEARALKKQRAEEIYAAKLRKERLRDEREIEKRMAREAKEDEELGFSYKRFKAKKEQAEEEEKKLERVKEEYEQEKLEEEKARLEEENRQKKLRSIKKGRKALSDSSEGEAEESEGEGEGEGEEDRLTDNRKVVVEDCLYVDDLEVLFYTLLVPKSSTIFVTHTRAKEPLEESNVLQDDSKSGGKSGKDKDELPAFYPVMAQLKGHKNIDPPSILFVQESGCVISGEKVLKDDKSAKNKEELEKELFKVRQQEARGEVIPTENPYQKMAELAQKEYEILVWNVQRDMTERYQVPVYHRFSAHNGSIIDLCYMPQSQLIVTASTDQTIRFFDPVATPHLLSDPSNTPHVKVKPGYYKPMEPEYTQSNSTFTEVKRIYTGSDATCHQLRCLSITSEEEVPSEDDPEEMKVKVSKMETLVTLKLGRKKIVGSKLIQTGSISGYGIERLNLQIPAHRHDDPVPSKIMEDCERHMQLRRQGVVQKFQQSLPLTLEGVMSSNSLQNYNMNKINQLFKQSVLTRDGNNEILEDPLRQIYKIILTLPNRQKFEDFLSTSGRQGSLSVSETFNYLQKFKQVHPLRTTQIEFENSIKEFKVKQDRIFIDNGKVKQPNPALQKLADYIRVSGIDIAELTDASSVRGIMDSCSREKMTKFLLNVQQEIDDFYNEDIETILADLDPYYSGLIPVDSISRKFKEEIHYHSIHTLNRPREIINQIRSMVVPHRKLAMQKAFTTVDSHGDGYIDIKQFLEAFRLAEVDVDIQVLEYLFDSFATGEVMSTAYFMGRLFSNDELYEIHKIDQILSKIKTAMIYKGTDFADVYGDIKEDDDFNIVQHFKTYRYALKPDDFQDRIMSLGIPELSQNEVIRIANFLSVNQGEIKLIYCNNFLHHMRRIASTTQISPKIIIYEKLLRDLQQTDKKFLENSDLRQILTSCNMSVPDQDVFISQLTQNDKIHYEDFIAKVRGELAEHAHYCSSIDATTKFGKIIQEHIQEEGRFNRAELIARCEKFDHRRLGTVQASHLISILKYNYQDLFDKEMLEQMQYHLECQSADAEVDYKEFVNQYFQNQTNDGEDVTMSPRLTNDPFNKSKHSYLVEDYEEIVLRISKKVKESDINLEKAFKLFDADQDGNLTYEEFIKTLKLCNIDLTETEYKIIFQFADEDQDELLSYDEFNNQVVHAKDVQSAFDVNKWILEGQHLDISELENVYRHQDNIMHQLEQDSGDYFSGIITKDQFINLLRATEIGLTEEDVDKITEYAIRGSQRKRPQNEPETEALTSTVHSLVHMSNFIKSLDPVIEYLKDQERKESRSLFSQTQNEVFEEIDKREQQKLRANGVKEKDAELLKKKITDIFEDREISFYDCFSHLFNQSNPTQSFISLKDFQNSVKSLNLPLTLQEYRMLIKIADPYCKSRIQVQTFCKKFENPKLRKQRLEGILKRVATAFYLRNFNLRRAFSLFDRNGDGVLTRNEFHDGWNQLGLGLAAFEIDELMAIVDTDRSGDISQAEFISKLDIHVKSDDKDLQERVKEQIFLRIKEYTEHGKIQDLIQPYDPSMSGYVAKSSLVKALNKIGIMDLKDMELNILLKAAGVRPEETKIQYLEFSKKLSQTVSKAINNKIKRSRDLLRKLQTVLKAKHMSIFECFLQLDVNMNRSISYLELKTGIQNYNIPVDNKELKILWRFMKKTGRKLNKKAHIEVKQDSINYLVFLQAFADAGLLQLEDPNGNTDMLMNKFRNQMQRKKISVGKAFQVFDHKGKGVATKEHFTSACLKEFNLKFDKRELIRIFDHICTVDQDADAPRKFNFTIKQLKNSISSKKDELWLAKAFIKINSTAEQKKKSYQRLFKEWKDTGSKLQAGVLSSEEVQNGLKKMKAGLTSDEISLVIAALDFDEEDDTITHQVFSKEVLSQAESQHTKMANKKMMLEDFVNQFNTKIHENDIPLEKLVAQFDDGHKGGLTFFEFDAMASFIDIEMDKKSLKELFQGIDINNNQVVRFEELKRFLTNADIVQEEEVDLDDQEDEDQVGSGKVQLDNKSSVDQELINAGQEMMKFLTTELPKKEVEQIEQQLTEKLVSDTCIDPALNQCCAKLLEIHQKYEITIDLVEFFYYLNTNITGKLSSNDFASNIGLVKSGDGVNLGSANPKNRSKIVGILKKVSGHLRELKLNFRQIMTYFDINQNQYITKNEFITLVRQLSEEMDSSEIRTLMGFLDRENTGKIFVPDFLRGLHECMSQGDSSYVYNQCRPIFEKLVRELGEDCDRFLDDISQYEQQAIDGRKHKGGPTKTGVQSVKFFKTLNKYDLFLDEDEKTILTSSFGIPNFPGHLDIHQIFTFFENFQNQLAEQVATHKFEKGKPLSMDSIFDSKKQENIKLKLINAVEKKIKGEATAQEVFALLNEYKVGLITIRELKTKLKSQFSIDLEHDSYLLELFKLIDSDQLTGPITKPPEKKKSGNIQYEIFEHLVKILEQKNLTLREVFDQIDTNKNGVIELDEFKELLERLGFSIKIEDLYNILKEMDDNFDGGISYKELVKHIMKLDINLQKVYTDEKMKEEVQYRDKAIEAVVYCLNNINTDFNEYFRQFDSDHDNMLTPREFRDALLSAKDRKYNALQVERVMHMMFDREEKDTSLDSEGGPISLDRRADITRISRKLKDYSYIDKSSSQATVSIDEDLFVFIVKNFDGLSRLIECVNTLNRKTYYSHRHPSEYSLRGLDLLSNQKVLQRLIQKEDRIRQTFTNLLKMLSKESIEMIRDEAQVCTLDPLYNVNHMVTDEDQLPLLQVPAVQSSSFEVDWTTCRSLSSGSREYQGFVPDTKESISIVITPNEDLSYISMDGKSYDRHLDLELKVMRAMNEPEDPESLEPEKPIVFKNYGKFEKKLGLEASEKEVYVVNEYVDKETFFTFEDFVTNNGGLLNIPMFFRSDATLYVTRYWAQKMLKIVDRLHRNGIVLRTLSLDQVSISKDGSDIRLNHFRGVGKVNNFGNVYFGPDSFLSLDPIGGIKDQDECNESVAGEQKQYKSSVLNNPFVAPEMLFQKFNEHTAAIDVWGFGMVMFCVLFGKPPKSIYGVYREWYKECHGQDIEDLDLSLPYTPPNGSSFIYDPFNEVIQETTGDIQTDITNPNQQNKDKKGYNFDYVVKTIRNKSYSSLFDKHASEEGKTLGFNEGKMKKRFAFNSFAEQLKQTNEAGPLSKLTDLSIYENKNEIGLIVDLVSSCLNLDPKKRPTIQGLLKSPLFHTDKYQALSAQRFSKNVILYRSPYTVVVDKLTFPLRKLCTMVLCDANQILYIETQMHKMFDYAREAFLHRPTRLTHEREHNHREADAPLAKQMIQDKVVDMLIFLTLRHYSRQGIKSMKEANSKEGKEKLRILGRLVELLQMMVLEMHAYTTPMAPYVGQVLGYLTKTFVGEESGHLVSELVLRQQDFFLRNESHLKEGFKPDLADLKWYKQKSTSKDHWDPLLYEQIAPVYKDAITESGLGQSCYPVICDYIESTTNSVEEDKLFSKNLNKSNQDYLIKNIKTASYYNELVPIADSLQRLSAPDIQSAGKRITLSIIKCIFQTGNSEKIKACLDMRIPRHIARFIQDSDADVRQECLLIFYEISKGLQDEDLDVVGKVGMNEKPEMAKHLHKKTAFDQHKTMLRSMSEEEGRARERNGLANLHFQSSKRFLGHMAKCFENPLFVAPMIRLLKNPGESYANKAVVLRIVTNLMCGDAKVLDALSTPACDTYLTLLKLLMIKKTGTGQTKVSEALAARATELFKTMFENRRPRVLKELSSIGATHTLLREQSLALPPPVKLPDIVLYVDQLEELEVLLPRHIIKEDYLQMVRDLRCWIKFDESAIPELIKIKAIEQVLLMTLKVMDVVWDDYDHCEHRRADYLEIIYESLKLLDWLCARDQQFFLFNQQNGAHALKFVVEKVTLVLTYFKRTSGESDRRAPMEEIVFNKSQKGAVKEKKYDTFPFNSIGTVLQNILYKLIKKDDPFLNGLLSEVNFGYLFGEFLVLEYDFLRHTIDYQIEGLVMLDTFVKKNEIRLNTFEQILINTDPEFRSQFIRSGVIETICKENIGDFSQFNVTFNKIDQSIIAFRKCYPMRMEAITLLNTVLLHRESAPDVFKEFMMYIRRHFVIRNEVAHLATLKAGAEEITSLLFLSVVLESKDNDLIYLVRQEGAQEVISQILKEKPSLYRRFPALAEFLDE